MRPHAPDVKQQAATLGARGLGNWEAATLLLTAPVAASGGRRQPPPFLQPPPKLAVAWTRAAARLVS